MTAAISINNVRKRYGRFEALAGVSFDIRQGEFFGLLGPNGAGKSTLIHCIAGLARISDGSIAVLGNDVSRSFRRARSSLGVVPQELVYDPFFTVESLLRIQAGYYGLGREQWPWIDRLLSALELDDKRQSTMRQLSGGMKRRVLIAQALVHKPPVVVLDEPTAGVDVELRRSLWAFTRELHAEGHSIVLTTHYLEEAEALCERIAILHHGSLRALEATRDVLGMHPFRFLTLRYSGDKALPTALQPFVVTIDEAATTASPDRGDEVLVGETASGQTASHTIELRLPKAKTSIGDVLDSLVSAGIRVDDVQTREPTLEDVFVQLTDDTRPDR